MKKAQWKQDPRERAFGKDPRELLNQKLTEHVQDLEEKIAYLNQRYAAQKENWDAQRESFLARIKRLHDKAEAYTWLRNAGVVVTSDEEFKHLKGEDMDAFFAIKPNHPKPLWQTMMENQLNTQAAGQTATQALLQAQIEAQIKKCQQEWEESILRGTSATHAFFDEITSPWLPLQK